MFTDPPSAINQTGTECVLSANPVRGEFEYFVVVNTEFLVTALIVVVVPGTGVIYTVSYGLFHGRRASIFAALGCTAGIVPPLAASILGLSALLQTTA